jgi:hypothetical protein
MLTILTLLKRPDVFAALVKLLEVPIAERGAEAHDDTYIQDVEEAGYQVTFARLSTAGKTKKDYTAAVSDAKMFFAQGMHVLRNSPAAQRLPQSVFAQIA